MASTPASDHAELLAEALESLGLEVHVPGPLDQADLVVEAGGRRLLVDLRRFAARKEAEPGHPDHVQVLVGSRIPADVRHRLREEGVNFLDRSGHLRLVAPPVVIDADVWAEHRHHAARPLDSPSGRDVAIACLADPGSKHGVREVARWTGRDAGGVSRLMSQLRELGLLRPDGRPVVPDLFRELSDRWDREQVPLAGSPAFTPDVDEQLRLGLLDLTAPGWALTDTVAAQAWGAPVVARGDYPPDFYLPDASTLRRAVRLIGRAADPEGRACTVAVPPAPVSCRHRVDRSTPYPVASHVVVALDLSLDRARGAESLRGWRPKDVARVW